MFIALAPSATMPIVVIRLFCWILTSSFGQPEGRASAAHLYTSVLQQHASRLLCRARHRGIVAHQVLRDRAVHKQGKLRRKTFRVGDFELFEEIAKPQAA